MIIFRRKNEKLMQKCLSCKHFVELKDDVKRYPKTRGIICNAPHSTYKNCFEYRWLFVDRSVRGVEPEPTKELKPVVTVPNDKMQDILKSLKKLGKR